MRSRKLRLTSKRAATYRTFVAITLILQQELLATRPFDSRICLSRIMIVLTVRMRCRQENEVATQVVDRWSMLADCRWTDNNIIYSVLVFVLL